MDYYKSKYGIPEHEVMEQWVRQGKRCYICSVVIRKKGRSKFHLDHCHTTGKIRGLLCFACNRLVGKVERNVGMHNRLWTYIESNGIWHGEYKSKGFN